MYSCNLNFDRRFIQSILCYGLLHKIRDKFMSFGRKIVKTRCEHVFNRLIKYSTDVEFHQVPSKNKISHELPSSRKHYLNKIRAAIIFTALYSKVHINFIYNFTNLFDDILYKLKKSQLKFQKVFLKFIILFLFIFYYLYSYKNKILNYK